jgi:hypothetical protein
MHMFAGEHGGFYQTIIVLLVRSLSRSESAFFQPITSFGKLTTHSVGEMTLGQLKPVG